MIRQWNDFWAGPGAGLFASVPVAGWVLAVQVVLLLVGVPLWLRHLDRRRWRASRQALVEMALAVHLAAATHAATVARALFRHNQAPPLARLTATRDALAAERAGHARLMQRASLFGAAIDARLAALLAEAVDRGEQVGAALATLTRLYLKEARVTVASNAVHGGDTLDYGADQPVTPVHRDALVEAAAALAEGAVVHRAMLERALSRRQLRGRAEALDQAESLFEAVRDDVTRFVAGLQPVDPDSIAYRTRPTGGGARSLDALIARFDRAGTLA